MSNAVELTGEAPTAEQIRRFESAMLEMPQVEIPLEHTFAPGLYVRTITVPAGATLVGKVHATDHIFIISKGDMTLVSEEGRGAFRLRFSASQKPA